LVFHIWQSVHSEFVRFSYYAFVWCSLLALAVCGFWFLIGGPGGKWLLRAAAILVALFVLLNFLLAWGHGGAHGNYDYTLYATLAAIVAFCGVTVVVAGMQPNPTIERDGPQAARPSL
jgi:hypothetical protein